jgi:CRISPR/Cas system-associated exonuclease Cas4 (RecB family)
LSSSALPPSPSSSSSSLSSSYLDNEIKFTGTQVNYYFVCKRKLWLFSHNIELEPESDLVKLGKLLHENRYTRKMKEVQVGRIKIDFMEKEKTKGLQRKELRDEAKEEEEQEENMQIDNTAESTATIPDDVGGALNRPSSPSVPTLNTVSCEGINPERLVGPQVRGQTEKKEEEGEQQHQQQQQNSIVIHEVKRSKKMQDAHFYQLLYYMYCLKRDFGVRVSHGVLHYPLLKQNVEVGLTQDRVRQLEDAINGIAEVNSFPRPPGPEWKRYCRSCAYQELCWG